MKEINVIKAVRTNRERYYNAFKHWQDRNGRDHYSGSITLEGRYYILNEDGNKIELSADRVIEVQEERMPEDEFVKLCADYYMRFDREPEDTFDYDDDIGNR
jgi:hypothetical protein